MVFLAIILSYITYLYIEKPLQRSNKTEYTAITLLILMTLITVISIFSYIKERGEGLPRDFNYMNEAINEIVDDDLKYMENDCGLSTEDKRLLGNCFQDLRERARYALLGDSKAGSLYGGLVVTGSKGGRWLFMGGAGASGSGFVPVITENEYYSKTQKPTKIALDAISRNSSIKTVVLASATRALFKLKNEYSIEDLPENGNYATVLSGLTNVVNILIGAGKNVVLLVDNPTLADPTICVERKTKFNFINRAIAAKNTKYCSVTLAKQLEMSKKYRQLLDEVKKIHPDKITIFDTTPLLCDESKGLCLPTKDGHVLYVFTDHISNYAARLIGAELNNYLNTH